MFYFTHACCRKKLCTSFLSDFMYLFKISSFLFCYFTSENMKISRFRYDLGFSASFLDIYLKFQTNGQGFTRPYYKRDDFNFEYLDNNIPTAPAYGGYILQLLHCATFQLASRLGLTFY